jgi:excisionase family DNA binding protein
MTQLAVPTLSDLVREPGKLSFVPMESIPAFRAELARLDSLLLARITFRDGSHRGADGTFTEDRLLGVKEAAATFGMSRDYLYRHSSKLPFTVRVGRKVLFSKAGIERYIRQHSGR